MYCTKCGVQMQDEVNFCPSCGHETARGAESRRAYSGGSSDPKRLYRLASDRKIAGVCSGLAQYCGADPTLVRLAWAAGTIVSCGAGLLAYGAAWIIVPVDPHDGVARTAPTPSAV